MLGRTCRLVATVACAAALLSFSNTAQADEPTSAPTTTSPRTQRELRALVVQGRGTEARAAITERLEGDLSNAERAATLELFAINEGWQGGVPRPIDVEEGPSPPDWTSALDLARREIALGAYRSAARRLNALVGIAPNLIEAARAIELREIARAALALHAPEPAATSPEPRAEATPKKKEEWYGWQTLVSDGIVIASAPVMPAAAAVTYLCGAPVVHLAHGNFAKAGQSLGVRVGLPAAGGLTGLTVAYVMSGGECRGDLCGLGLVLFGGVGLILGALGAVAVDAAVLSYDRVPDTRHSTTGSSRPRYKVEVQPTAGPRREGGFDVGIGGTW